MRIKVTLLMIVTAIVSLCGCSQKKDVLNVYNWGDYIDQEIIKMFEKETGISVIYEVYATNEEMYTKVKNGSSKYDMVIPSDYMIKRMINEELLEKIDLSKIENVKHINPNLMDMEFDKGNQYSIPYFWGTMGIIVNRELNQDEFTSWADMWKEEYKGKFTMIDSQRDTLMVPLKLLGYSMNTQNIDELNEAGRKLIEQKPLVLAYVVDTVKDMLLNNEIEFALVWSGDAGLVTQEKDIFEYIIPKEGTNIFFDNMAVPKGGNVELAQKFMDYMMRPEIAAMNAKYVGYSTPNVAAKDLLDQKFIDRNWAYPDVSKLENSEAFLDLGDFVAEYDRVWTEIKAH